MVSTVPKAREVYRFCSESTNIPVVTSYNAVDLFPSVYSNFVGRVGIKGTRAGNFAMQNCDLLLVIGCRLPVPVTGYNYKTFAREAKVIVVDIDKDEHSKNTVEIDRFIHRDAKDFLTLNKFEREKNDWNEICRLWKKKWTLSVLARTHQRR